MTANYFIVNLTDKLSVPGKYEEPSFPLQQPFTDTTLLPNEPLPSLLCIYYLLFNTVYYYYIDGRVGVGRVQKRNNVGGFS